MGGFGTQEENEFDSLAQMKFQTLSLQIAVSRDGGNGKGNVSQVFSFPPISTTRAPTLNLQFKPNYLVHATSSGKKGKNQSGETFLLESKKWLLAKQNVNKSKIMHVQHDTINALI